MRRFWFLIVIGGLGLAVLLALGGWQLQRLAWKSAVLADITARMATPLDGLPAQPEEARDEYRSLTLEGTVEKGALRVLTSRPPDGPGYRVIAPFRLADGRRVMLDRGFLPEADKDSTLPAGPDRVEGNLLWPDDVNSFTPAPNIERNIWFARDVAPMARALGTEPLLIVARSESLPGTDPMPVSVNIPNDHLEYALTWFALAAGWFGMCLYFIAVRRRG
ncbi:SURF1 family protein (plasmid) [Paroceanicella profunda]|uniref:SURF1-like protein n=1 Tax=Paroceanicella profunda TaxID=2579971 RepID=A0A5B8G5E9_9RHOB|nr:SURF1 family protein [Paroceanicella profunda]QDL94193.1 SURF1 family protein [Paroceanicella profunda]